MPGFQAPAPLAQLLEILTRPGQLIPVAMGNHLDPIQHVDVITGFQNGESVYDKNYHLLERDSVCETRYPKLTRSLSTAICLAYITRCFRSYFSDNA